MSKFIDLVRTGKVKGPQQTSFKLEKWNAEYANVSSPSDSDTGLHSAGIWFHRELSRVREATETLSKYLTTPDPKRLFVGLATHEWLLVCRKMAERLQSSRGKEVFPEELAQGPLTTIFGTQTTPQGVIELSVDSLRFPLSTFTTAVQGIPCQPHQVLEAAINLFVAAQLYHILEQLWLQLIWNDYRFEETGERILISPSSSPVHTAEAVSHFRRQSRQSEAVGLAVNYWRHSLSEPVKRTFLQKRKLFTIIKKPTGKIRVKVSEASRHPENPYAPPVQHIFLTHDYADDYIRNTVPEFRNLTIEQVILAYELLSQIPRQMRDVLPPLTPGTTPEVAMSYAAEFDREELLHAFQKALNTSAAQSDFLLTYMTHTGSVRDQLWFKPIVDLGDGKISILLPAVDGIHYFRLVDHILKDIPNAETKMGELFETHVRQTLAETASSYKFAPDLCVYQKTLHLTVGEQSEQIDLAVALGHRIFIGECKASLYPAEPLEIHHYLKKLTEDAVPQAQRKTAFVRDHLTDFLTAVDFPIDAHATEVLPLVVTNGNLYCGYPMSGVPIVDILILRRYFEEGKLPISVRTDDNGALTPTRTEEFYTSRSEALNNFVNYLLHPPQVKVFESAVVLEERPLPKDANAKPAAFREFVVRPDYEALKEEIRASRDEKHQSTLGSQQLDSSGIIMGSIRVGEAFRPRLNK
jgi:hypothetical protein